MCYKSLFKCAFAPHINSKTIAKSFSRLSDSTKAHLRVKRRTHSAAKTQPKKTNLIGRHQQKGTKPIGRHLPKEAESMGKETEKIDRESPLNTNAQHTNCLYQTHYISSDTRWTCPSTARGRSGTEGGGGNLIADPRVVETKASRKAKVLGKSTV